MKRLTPLISVLCLLHFSSCTLLQKNSPPSPNQTSTQQEKKPFFSFLSKKKDAPAQNKIVKRSTEEKKPFFSFLSKKKDAPAQTTTTVKKTSKDVQKNRNSSQPKPTRVSSSTISRLEKSMNNLVNQYRASLGKKPFKYHSGLAKIARSHSQYMAKNPGKFAFRQSITHDFFEHRASIAQKKWNMEITENVASGDYDPDVAAQKLFQAWLKSYGHRKNITTDWEHTGIGASIGATGKVYFTQLFGSPYIRKNINDAGYLGPRDW